MSVGLFRRLTTATTIFQRSARPVRYNHSFSNMSQSSAFTKAVIASMRRLYPESLAEKTWDNTGTLLEVPEQPDKPKSNSVLLTIDLTKAVADEAIKGNHSVIVTYHPIIFRPLKSLTLKDSQQQSLLRLAANGISVYSPHTAADTIPGGTGDWLCDLVTGREDEPMPEAKTAEQEQDKEAAAPASVSGEGQEAGGDVQSTTLVDKRPAPPERAYSKPNYMPSYSTNFHPDVIPHTRSVITPSPKASIDAANSLFQTSDSNPRPFNAENTGAGRVITFNEPQPLTVLIPRIATAIGLPKAFPIAIPQDATIEDMMIKTIGLCAGSGADVIRAADPPPDLILTGEMTHHIALAVIERGGCIMKLFHSNSERGYLEAVMRPRLEAELNKEWQKVKGDSDGEIDVVVSRMDRDPFGIVVLEDGASEQPDSN